MDAVVFLYSPINGETQIGGEVVFMFEIIAFVATIIVGVFAESIGAGSHISGAGSIAAIATMGAFILWTVRHKK